MAASRLCERCKKHFAVEEVCELQYWAAGIGNYYTIHLCKADCHRDFEKLFMRGHATEGL